ncbi:hypothetical protein Y032_0012g1906 [Ancylostoma ceylanicum]|uniref:Uncharacterized protein n=1 Tax=Ancylostoma ceylanicum TaxID=53326 RepID=A0A016VDF9_9BILA|nr:hypothetical protein Y032_0012g1906 [Ancylostoma ceylanicum]
MRAKRASIEVWKSGVSRTDRLWSTLVNLKTNGERLFCIETSNQTSAKLPLSSPSNVFDSHTTGSSMPMS